MLLFFAQGFEAYEASVYTDVIGWSRIHGTKVVDMITTGLRTEAFKLLELLTDKENVDVVKKYMRFT